MKPVPALRTLDPDKLYDTRTVARMLGRSVSAVWIWVKRGWIRPNNPGEWKKYFYGDEIKRCRDLLARKAEHYDNHRTKTPPALPPLDPDVQYTVQDVARMFGLAPPTIQRDISLGRLCPADTRTWKRHFTADAIWQYHETRTQKTQPLLPKNKKA